MRWICGGLLHVTTVDTWFTETEAEETDQREAALNCQHGEVQSHKIFHPTTKNRSLQRNLILLGIIRSGPPPQPWRLVLLGLLWRGAFESRCVRLVYTFRCFPQLLQRNGLGGYCRGKAALSNSWVSTPGPKPRRFASYKHTEPFILFLSFFPNVPRGQCISRSTDMYRSGSLLLFWSTSGKDRHSDSPIQPNASLAFHSDKVPDLC